MRVRVLGSAAGGGLPQWNCGCDRCARARSGTIAARTQDSVAVSADRERWVLLNASPDVRQQLAAHAELHPRAPRDCPVQAVVLTSADVDHCLGLFVLREGSPLAIHATAEVIDALRRHDALCRTLERRPGQTRWIALEPGRTDPLCAVDGTPTGLVVEPIVVPGKLPPHLDGLVAPHPNHNIALLVRAERGSTTLGYAPGVGGDAPGSRRVLSEADLVLFDGTFWSNHELDPLGSDQKSAREMAHWPLSGSEGSLETLGRHPRVVLSHINNTNPILVDGAERRAVLERGVRIAEDGMELLP
jgi:pyrroloquinoline quinone biosynthesis protein B